MDSGPLLIAGSASLLSESLCSIVRREQKRRGEKKQERRASLKYLVVYCPQLTKRTLYNSAPISKENK